MGPETVSGRRSARLPARSGRASPISAAHAQAGPDGGSVQFDLGHRRWGGGGGYLGEDRPTTRTPRPPTFENSTVYGPGSDAFTLVNRPTILRAFKMGIRSPTLGRYPSQRTRRVPDSFAVPATRSTSCRFGLSTSMLNVPSAACRKSPVTFRVPIGSREAHTQFDFAGSRTKPGSVLPWLNTLVSSSPNPANKAPRGIVHQFTPNMAYPPSPKMIEPSPFIQVADRGVGLASDATTAAETSPEPCWAWRMPGARQPRHPA